MNDDSRARLEQNRAARIVNALVDQEQTRCNDCGEVIDVSDATNTGLVVEALENHRQKCSGEWYDE